MKRLLTLLAILCVGVWLAWLFHYEQYGDERNLPPDQIAESVTVPLEGERSGQWTAVRNRFVEKHPECAACGSRSNLNVHHVVPFHVDPSLELEDSNLITLCAGSEANGQHNCHFRIGHDPDGPVGPKRSNWKASNSDVRSDAQTMYQRLQTSTWNN
jgi:hypothetical protein